MGILYITRKGHHMNTMGRYLQAS